MDTLPVLMVRKIFVNKSGWWWDDTDFIRMHCGMIQVFFFCFFFSIDWNFWVFIIFFFFNRAAFLDSHFIYGQEPNCAMRYHPQSHDLVFGRYLLRMASVDWLLCFSAWQSQRDVWLFELLHKHFVSGYYYTYTVNCLVSGVYCWLIGFGMDDRISMLISGDSLSDEPLNRGPWCFSWGDGMNFPLEWILCNFHFFSMIITKDVKSNC